MNVMDRALVVAADALAQGQPLLALKYVALRDDAPALTLRATAMAQLGDYKRAKLLYQRALAGFGSDERVLRARALVALAEVALAARELALNDVELVRARDLLAREGDLANACHAQLIRARHALALGDVDAADKRLNALDAEHGPLLVRALGQLLRAEVAVRRMQPSAARTALARAAEAAQETRIAALRAEVAAAAHTLEQPVARLISAHGAQELSLEQVARLLAGPHLIVDACRRTVQQGTRRLDFGKRPVLFALARRLAEASPNEVTREELLRVAFGMRRANDSLRARLRVSVGRLRKLLSGLCALEATSAGFALSARAKVHVLAPPLDDQAGSLLALVSDGEAWSTSALALALGASQRSVQRGLATLESEGKVRSVGRGRSRRWLAPPLTPFATHLLLPIASRPP